MELSPVGSIIHGLSEVSSSPCLSSGWWRRRAGEDFTPMRRPNVVFIMSDQHRWDFMGYEDNGETHTPNLDRLGRDGAIFRAAYCGSPLCCPSRQALMSGRYGMNSGCFTNLHELPPGAPTFVRQFRLAGYHTCAVGKTHMEIHAYDSDLCSEEHGAFMDSLGFDEVYEISGNGMFQTGIRCQYSDFLARNDALEDALEFYAFWGYFMDKTPGNHAFMPQEWSLDERLQETEFVGARAVEWLRGRGSSTPFFLHVGFAGPHSPVEPAPKFMDQYRDSDEPAPWGEPCEPWVMDGRRGYRAMISQIDRQVGAIYDCVAEQGELENTVFVFTADHGEMAGDHGRYGKTSFFEGSVRVPLIALAPWIGGGVDSRALVEILDLGRTVCDLCGVQPHALDQGRSLAPLMRGDTDSHRDTIYCEMGCDRMLFDGRFKLMWGDPKSDERRLGRLHLDKPVNIPPSPGMLYDMEQDPHEFDNLLGRSGSRDMLTDMLEKLVARIACNTQSRPNRSRGEYRPMRPAVAR